MRKLTQARLRTLIAYDPLTGVLTWRPRARRWFKSEGWWKRWNRKYANQPAFCTPNRGGYLQGQLFKRTFLSHRIAWLWMQGQWPRPQIDHLNGRRDDNRFSNLRQCTQQQNARNTAMTRRNRSGCVGVYRPRGYQHYCAFIEVAGRQHWLGHFASFQRAVAARKAAEREFGFSRRHGCRQAA